MQFGERKYIFHSKQKVNRERRLKQYILRYHCFINDKVNLYFRSHVAHVIAFSQILCKALSIQIFVKVSVL